MLLLQSWYFSINPPYLFQVWHSLALGCWRWGTRADFWSWWCSMPSSCFVFSNQEGSLLMWRGRRGKPNQTIEFPFLIIRQGNRAVSAVALWIWRGEEGGECVAGGKDGAIPPAHLEAAHLQPAHHTLCRSHPPDPRSWSSLPIQDRTHFTDVMY